MKTVRVLRLLLIPLRAGRHAKSPPAIQRLTALHHYKVNQVSRQRLVVGRQQHKVQAEENTVIHHAIATIDAGHTHLQGGGEK